MTVNRRNRRAEDVFWNLAALVSDSVLEIPFSRLTADLLRSDLRPGTRVCVPMSARPLSEVVAATAAVADAGMRPVVTARRPDPAALRVFDHALAELTGVGVRELIIRWPSSAAASDVLDGTARLVVERGLGSWGISDIGIAAASLAQRPPEPSADLLRAFDAVRACGRRYHIGFTVLGPSAHSVNSVVDWEHALRSAGNQLPVRVRLPGVAPNPFRRSVPMLLGLAAAAESDPECLLTGLHFVLRGSAARTSVFVDEIGCGNFVVEETVSGYRLSLLGSRKT